MLEKLNHIRGVDVFREFEWPAELSHFQQRNLIFGWNGTGKSTLASIFRSLEVGQVPSGDVQLTAGGRTLLADEIQRRTTAVRVFNREYVDRCIVAPMQVNGPDVPPIYSIGENSAKIQADLKTAVEETSRLELQLAEARRRKAAADDQLQRFSTEQAGSIRVALGADQTYRNYDRRDFKAAVEKMRRDGDGARHVLDEEGLSNRLMLHSTRMMSPLDPIGELWPGLDELHERVARLAQTNVVSESIDALKSDAALAEWIGHGLELHDTRRSSQCLYCGQRIPEDRLDRLRRHFNDSYSAFVNQLRQTIGDLQRLRKPLAVFAPPRPSELYEDIAPAYDEALKDFVAYASGVDSYLSLAESALKLKAERPFDSVPMVPTPPKVTDTLRQSANALIAKHNRRTSQYADDIRRAREEYACAVVAQSIPTYAQLEQQQHDLAQVAGDQLKQLENSGKRREGLQQQVRGIGKMAADLNRDLYEYLGHAEIRLIAKESGYEISRHNQPARRLSEGEITAIALLHFLRSLQADSLQLSDAIVVLDDPVCSLDNNALFTAFGFIKERTQAAGQLFIMTHNFAFFRMVRYWLKHSGQPAEFYMTECRLRNGHRSSALTKLPELLEKYESDYHYMFSCVVQFSKGSAQDLEAYYGAANLARRLLETFLEFRVPWAEARGEKLWGKLKTLQYDDRGTAKILRFLHAHSHADAVGGDQQDFSGLVEAPAVMRELLKLIKTTAPEHFHGMMRLIDPAYRPAVEPPVEMV